MPAAAVIPAPIAYIKVVAVKKLVVESQSMAAGPLVSGCPDRLDNISHRPQMLFAGCLGWSIRLL